MKCTSLTVAIAAIALAAAAVYAQAGNPEVAPEVEKALVGEDWAKVADLLAKVDTSTPSPALRVLKGHACLALNRNNESVRLLRDTGKNDEYADWQKWTLDFAATNPKSALAHYLKADAMARQQKLEQALVAFSSGLKVAPKNAMLLNGRAVCYAMLEKWNEAVVDLDDAAKVGPRLADVHANRGCMNIRRSLGAPGAKAAFLRALDISPDFVLAKIGLASALYGEGKWTDAEKLLQDLKTDDKQSQFLAEANLLLIRGNSIEALASLDSEKGVGATFDKALANSRQAFADSAKIRQQSWVGEGVGNFARDLGVGVKYAGDLAGSFVPSIEQDKGKWTIKAVSFAGVSKIGSDLQSAGTALRDISSAQKSTADLRMQDSANYMRQAQTIASSGNLGGVNTEGLRRGFLDKGNWGLLARFALQYPTSATTNQTTSLAPARN